MFYYKINNLIYKIELIYFKKLNSFNINIIMIIKKCYFYHMIYIIEY